MQAIFFVIALIVSASARQLSFFSNKIALNNKKVHQSPFALYAKAPSNDGNSNAAGKSGKATKPINPADNAANISNPNKGTPGTNRQYDQNQGNRGKQLNPNQKK